MYIMSTKERAIVEASNLSQQVGFSNFTLQLVAEKLGIKQPSIYQHFKSKDALGLELVANHRRRFEAWAETIEGFDPKEQIVAFFGVAQKFCDADKLCGYSALISDYNALSGEMKRAVSSMQKDQKKWVADIITRGQKERIFRTDKTSKQLSEYVLSNYIGSQILARVSARPECVADIKQSVLEQIVNKEYL
jgi:TetR/AcrR family transcriptional repressor of nem operon